MPVRKKHSPDRDAATGLPSKDIFYDRLTQALILARRNSQSLAVMFLIVESLNLLGALNGASPYLRRDSSNGKTRAILTASEQRMLER